MIKKVIFLLIGLTLGFIIAFVVLKQTQNKDSSVAGLFLDESKVFNNQDSVSPDGKYRSFLTANNLSMFGSEIWIQNLQTKQYSRLDSGTDYRFISSPVWNLESTKIAYIKIYPFELWITDLEGNKGMVYSEQEEEEENKINPALGYAGKANIRWLNNSEIEFENTKEIPSRFYAIDIESRDLRVTRDYVSTQISLKNINFTHYSQRDKKWGDINLGFCDTVTIHSAGCAVASAAMVLDYFDAQVNPESLDAMLSENYAGGYVDGCDIRWNIVQNYIEGVELKGVFLNEPDFKRLDYEIAQGNPVIAGFDRVKFTDIPHWLVVTEKRGDKYIVKDPWTIENKVKTLDEYGELNHLIVYRKAQ